MAFLYFIPGKVKTMSLSRADVNDAGLGYAFESSPVCCGTKAGPNEEAGTVIASVASIAGRRIGYYPKQQTWMEIPRSPCWIGWFNDAIPQPQNLRREDMLPGPSVRLSDGNWWQIPLARAVSSDEEDYEVQSAIPAARVLDESGQWVRGAPEARYAKLWDVANEVWDSVLEATESISDDKMELSFETDACVLALQANYRVASIEISVLGLLTDQTVSKIIKAMIGIDRLLERLKKKKDLSGDDTSDGDLGYIPNIDLQ